MSNWTHHRGSVGDVELHWVEQGQGPTVIMLHGFPEFWYAWQHQIPALAKAGFRAVAPDMRGYNTSDKPRGVAAYRLEKLTEDICGLVDALGVERASVVGHDWGAVVAWSFAMSYPERLERLAILNGPHPVAMERALLGPQVIRSWYILAFQLPLLPERALSARDFALLKDGLTRGPRRKDAFGPKDIEQYVKAWNQPGALTASLNYYRAALRYSPPGTATRRAAPVKAPVLCMWGREDSFLGMETANPGPKWAPNFRWEVMPEAGHWLMADAPERVNECLIDFCR